MNIIENTEFGGERPLFRPRGLRPENVIIITDCVIRLKDERTCSSD